MRYKLNNLCLFLFVFGGLLLHAQERTITGTVSDESGSLPGVSIIIKGTTVGTETDFDGKYAIQANAGDILIFSFVGQVTQEKTIGLSNTIDVLMVADRNVLDEVVVTALGIRREKKALGYAVSEISSDDLEQKAQPDLGRLLKGKAAGVNVQANSGLTGSGTNVVIRGFTSITGANQALFVIDGVPFEGGANEQSAFFDGVTESSRFLDIDPNNIKNVSVLKGLSATALYGNRGRNGVILITTKSGSIDDREGRSKLTLSSSVFFSKPHLPNYQDEFGGGFNQTFGWFFSNWGPSFSDTNPASFGSYFSSTQGNVQLTHPFLTNQVQSFITGFEDLRDSEYSYRPYNSVEDFFRTGISNNTSVSLTGGNSKFSYSVGYSNLDDKGFTPGNSLKRNNFNIGGSATHGKLKVNGSINFTKTDYKSPPIAASAGNGAASLGASLFGNLFFTPRNVDLINIPFERLDGGSLYYREDNSIQHPLWTVKNSKTGQKVNNIFASFNLSYAITDYLSANYRYGLNTYNEDNLYSQNKGGIDGDVTGILRTSTVKRTNTDHNISLVFNKDISDKFDLTANVGFNSNRREFDRDGVESTGQIVFGVERHFNFSNQSTINSFTGLGIQARSEENTYGVFGDITLGYDNFLYLNLQGRNDWTSTLESDFNTILYPSASLSFIPTTIVDGLKSDKWGLNYLKLRAGFGSSAGFPPTYTTRTTLGINGSLFVDNNGALLSGNSTSNLLGNPLLEPETVEEIELGLESKFLDNRVTLNASIFQKETKDLITQRGLDPSTGFTSTFTNGGDLEIKGIELDLNADVIKTEDFIWNIGLNFYADESEITRLPAGVQRITIGGSFFASDARNAAVVGQPYGVFLGTDVLRDASGNLLVGTDGNYLSTPTNNNIIGDPNPDFTSSIQSTFSYKGLSLNIGFQYRKGGDIYNTTTSTLQNRGVIAFPLSRFNSYVLPGVDANGQPNSVQINATDLAFNNWLFGPTSFRIYDGTFIRLSEASLSYNLPKKVLDKTPFTGLNFTISGSNLWYKAINIPDDANFDVNSNSIGVGNNLGLDFFSGPSAARYGFSVKVEL